jgi:hypothetical protein
MAGEIGNTVQDYVNQTVEKGDAPAQENRGAPGDQAVRSPQIDKRVILAIIKAVTKYNSFVIPYGAVMDELSEMIEDDNEYYEIEEKLYDALYERGLKYVYDVYHADDSSEDLIVISPHELSEKELAILREIANVLDYNDEVYDDVKTVINVLIEKWSSSCLEVKKPATVIYTLAKNYGLNVRIVEDETTKPPYTGKVVYNIEDVVNVEKHYFYCNDCIDIPRHNNFIEKCASWHIT